MSKIEELIKKGKLKHATENFYIACLDGEAVGCMALVDYDPAFWPDIQKGESLFIHKLAVKRSGAGKGVSNALIYFAKKECKSRNIKYIRLDCHQFRDKVRKLYENEGFICVDERCLWGKYHTAFYVWHYDDVICHYDNLIDESNDPARDPKLLQEYMNKWDGQGFMHIEDKQPAINKVSKLLKAGGRFVLSISKCQDSVLDFENRKIKLFPDDAESIAAYIKKAGLFIEKQFDIEFATVFVAVALKLKVSKVILTTGAV